MHLLSPAATPSLEHGHQVSKLAASGKGAIPKHYQDQVRLALHALAYRDLKAAALAKVREADMDAELDALQILATGIIVNSTGAVTPRKWSALATLIADGPKRGVQADLVDVEMTRFSSIARTRSVEMLGRAVAFQLSPGKNTVHENLRGFAPTWLDDALAPESWSAVDLGRVYREARAQLRDEVAPTSQDEPYSTLLDVEDAMQVAEAVLALKGVLGTGEGSIPHALRLVAESWRLYGGPGVGDAAKGKLASCGRALIADSLMLIGQSRHAALSPKNPMQLLFDQHVPARATQAFELHLARLQGALTMTSYLSYTAAPRDGCYKAVAAKKGGKGSPGGGGGGGHEGGAPTTTKLRVDITPATDSVVARTPSGRKLWFKLSELEAAAEEPGCVKGLLGRVYNCEHLCTRHEKGCAKHKFRAGQGPNKLASDGPLKTIAKKAIRRQRGKAMAQAAAQQGSEGPSRHMRVPPLPPSHHHHQRTALACTADHPPCEHGSALRSAHTSVNARR